MNPFARIQQEAADAIVAWPALGLLPVVMDDGTKQQEVEDNLATSGACALVGVPSRFAASANAHKTVAGEVSLSVDVFFNPEVKRTPPWNIPQTVGEVVLALVSTPVVQARNHFEVEGFDIVAAEPGLIVFAVDVKRLATVSA